MIAFTISERDSDPFDPFDFDDAVPDAVEAEVEPEPPLVVELGMAVRSIYWGV